MNKDYLKERELLDKQIRECMPLIETERSIYIKAEHGRLQAIMGTGYQNKKSNEPEIFHGQKGDDISLIEDMPKDPYDITVEELYWITEQFKHIERCGTDTYMNFFNMMPEDKERIKLISEIWHKLTHETMCAEREIEKLKEGHDAFIERKLTDPVEVIR